MRSVMTVSFPGAEKFSFPPWKSPSFECIGQVLKILDDLNFLFTTLHRLCNNMCSLEVNFTLFLSLSIVHLNSL